MLEQGSIFEQIYVSRTFKCAFSLIIRSSEMSMIKTTERLINSLVSMIASHDFTAASLDLCVCFWLLQRVLDDRVQAMGVHSVDNIQLPTIENPPLPEFDQPRRS